MSALFICHENLDVVARYLIERRKRDRRESEAEIVGFGKARRWHGLSPSPEGRRG